MLVQPPSVMVNPEALAELEIQAARRHADASVVPDESAWKCDVPVAFWNTSMTETEHGSRCIAQAWMADPPEGFRVMTAPEPFDVPNQHPIR